MLGGPIGILDAGRSSDDELGTFTSSLTELDLTGMFLGHSLEVMLGPMTSSGPTTLQVRPMTVCAFALPRIAPAIVKTTAPEAAATARTPAPAGVLLLIVQFTLPSTTITRGLVWVT